MKTLHWKIPEIFRMKFNVEFLNSSSFILIAQGEKYDVPLNLNQKLYDEVRRKDEEYSQNLTYFRRCFIHEYLELRKEGAQINV